MFLFRQAFLCVFTSILFYSQQYCKAQLKMRMEFAPYMLKLLLPNYLLFRMGSEIIMIIMIIIIGGKVGEHEKGA